MTTDTVIIQKELHTRFKMLCLKEGVKMNDEMIAMIKTRRK